MLEFGHLSHPGLNRECNEDTYAAELEPGLWLVADGMGGFGAGDVASALVREAVIAEVRSGAALDAAIRSAGEQVQHFARQHVPARPLGASVVAARIAGQRFQTAQVGDCRAWLWQAGRVYDLSPHAPDLGTLHAQGMIDPLPAAPANTATQALGITAPERLHVHRVDGHWQPGSQLLLCSDGVNGSVDAAALTRILADPGCSAQECVDWLIASALDGGGSDNVTAVLIRQHQERL